MREVFEEWRLVLQMSVGAKTKPRDLPGGPVVGTLPSSTGDVGLIPGQGAKIPTCLMTKKKKKRPNQKSQVIGRFEVTTLWCESFPLPCHGSGIGLTALLGGTPWPHLPWFWSHTRLPEALFTRVFHWGTSLTRRDVGRGTRGTRKAPVPHPNITHMYEEGKTAKQQKSKKNFWQQLGQRGIMLEEKKERERRLKQRALRHSKSLPGNSQSRNYLFKSQRVF